jgi:hypothetical protein
VVWVLWLIACNDKSDGGGGLDTGENAEGGGNAGGGGAGGSGGAPPPCAPNGIANEVSEWALPTAYPAGNFAGLGNFDCPEDTTLLWSALDLDGDGPLDAVGTSLCDGGGETGKSSWAVHFGTAAGFADTATAFAMPEGYPVGTWDGTSNFDCPSGGALEWVLVQMDGVGGPDVLGVQLCDGSQGVGLDHWRVHLNDGTGFGEAVDWALPAGFDPGTFDDVGNLACTSNMDLEWSLVDFDGDGLSDILGTSGCAGGTLVGSTEWLLWRGTATGYLDPPESIALPTSYAPGAFDSPGLSFCESGASPLWSLLDLTGDGWLDIVVTDRCDEDDTVGIVLWTVHAGSATGFADPGLDWALPSDIPPGNIRTLGDSVCDLGGDEILWSLLDVTRDGVPDAVATAPCNGIGALGRTEWRIYAGTSSGFAEPTSWWLPTDQPAGVYDALGNTECPTPSTLLWSAADVQGDGALDVVGTSLCDDSGGVGFGAWSLHVGACDVSEPAQPTTP